MREAMPEQRIREFMNVGEDWLLYDTVLMISTPAQAVDGWFTSYLTMGQAADIQFFNVRNRAIGLPYNNQDTRDQIPYAFMLQTLGVSFFGNSVSQAAQWEPPDSGSAWAMNDYNQHIFTNDLPRHASVVLKVQQDEVLKNAVMFTPPGYGPYGSGYGRGQPSSQHPGSYDHIAAIQTQGLPALKNRWAFPQPIELPRLASVSLRLRFSNWGRNLLQAINFGSGLWQTSDNTGLTDYVTQHQIISGIQVTMGGKRLVQQRGELHA